MPAAGRCAAMTDRRRRAEVIDPRQPASVSFYPRAAGFALLEVLIAGAVLAVGLTGAAALAADAVRAQHGASLRAHAVNLATDLAERLRANPAGLLSYAEPPGSFGCVSGPTAARRCTPRELARHDLAEWLGDIQDALPDGRGAVVTDAETTPVSYAISIQWTGRRGSERFALEGRL